MQTTVHSRPPRGCFFVRYQRKAISIVIYMSSPSQHNPPQGTYWPFPERAYPYPSLEGSLPIEVPLYHTDQASLGPYATYGQMTELNDGGLPIPREDFARC